MAQAVLRPNSHLEERTAGRSGPLSGAERPATTTLVVVDMHCGGCLRKVETALLAVPGVVRARANLAMRRVTVEHENGKFDALPLISALERAGFSAAELAHEDDGSLAASNRDYLRRLAVAGFAAANIMLLSVSVWSGANGDMSPALQTLFHWLSALIALPAVAYAGQPFFRSAAAALKAGRVNMDVPISLGVSLATAMSVYQTIRGSEQVYFDAAVTLLFFLLIGRALDQRMRARSAGAAANLLGLRSQSAQVVLPDGTTTRVSARSLKPGMKFVTAAGERFAADGRIVKGASQVDESLITGETRPRQIDAGASIFAGTMNLGEAVTVETTAAEDRTLIAEIARLMAAAEQGRARYVRLADRAAKLYAPAVHTLSLLTFLGWLALGHGWEPALTAAIAVLIITCPCALALAVPAVQVAATSRLFEKGVLVKAPDALERLAEIDVIALDKTGTLTLGEARIVNRDAIALDVLARAAALAAVSRHPLSRAVVRSAQEAGLSVIPAGDVREVPGFGLSRRTSEGEERLGSAAWCGADVSSTAALWYRGTNGARVAFETADMPRPDARVFIARLMSAGYSVTLLSGDQPAEVERVAKAVGITEFAARMLPGDKVARLSEMKVAGLRPLMIGDGLNDAPALAAGHASVSPASAVDISQTAADVIFQGERLEPVLEAIAVARRSRRMALENFAIAIGYNIVFVPLAMLGLVTPLIAAVAMSASSIAVTANALRLKSGSLQLGNWRSAP